MFKAVLKQSLRCKDRVNRNWGFYITFKNIKKEEDVIFREKLLAFSPKSQTQLQRHFHKDEIWISDSSFNYSLESEDDLVKEYIAKPYERVFIPKGKKHNIINNSDDFVYIFEMQTGICDESDVERF